MADPILHIKDSFFFEVPKVLAPANYKQLKELPEVWVKLDPTYQHWEFEQLYHELTNLGVGLPPEKVCESDWHAWVHSDHAHFAKPFDEFLNEKFLARQAEFRTWKAGLVAQARATKNDSQIRIAQESPIDDFMHQVHAFDPYAQFIIDRSKPGFDASWHAVRHKTGSYAAIRKYQEEHNDAPEWNIADEKAKAKFDAYNFHLSGKILIPQPFGELRNLHEAETTIINQRTGGLNSADFGFCISRFMLIEIGVGVVLWLLFSWLASRLLKGGPPRGKRWNFLEWFVVFIRDQIAKPALDGHHDDAHGHGDHGHGDHGHGEGHAEHGMRWHTQRMVTATTHALAMAPRSTPPHSRPASATRRYCVRSFSSFSA